MKFLYEALTEGGVLAAGLEVDTSEASAIRGILMCAREAAKQATVKLHAVDPHDWQAVQDLQNDVRRYSDLIVWVRAIKEEAKLIYDAMDEETRHTVEEEWFPRLEQGGLNDN